MICARRLGRLPVGQDVLSVDGIVTAIEDVAAPLADEHTLRGAALIASVRIHRAAALGGPPYDLDGVVLGVVDEVPVARNGSRGGVDDRHDDPSKSGRQI